ncbi:N-acetyltransferase [Gemella palaticanis]|uniref:N-acetyltransferase n=2 Tax=Gemelliphila palaticanis TaxID=81950 RepID=A0ABX2SYM9_9BACL|nr:N-acetyltransferase [Gemella palaticanis]NYS47122.1 N-acetyltransferase [Gemella palaticanis]
MNLQLNETKDQLFWNKDGELIAYVNFPKLSDDLHIITKVFVDESLRGQGVAGKLMEEIVKYAKENSIKLEASCPYAVSWFEKNK